MADDAITARFRVIAEARKELENRDPKPYWADVWEHGPPYPPHWCGGFCLAMLHRAGIALDIKWVFDPPKYGFLYRLPRVKRDVLPEMGDIAYFDEPYRHHALVVRCDGDTIWTIDGNTTLNRKDPLPPRVLEKERPLKSSGVVCYSINIWLPKEVDNGQPPSSN